MIQLAGINFQTLRNKFLDTEVLTERVERVLVRNKTDLEWSGAYQMMGSWSGALDLKMTRNFAKSGAGLGGGGWIEWLTTLLQNSSPKKYTKL